MRDRSSDKSRTIGQPAYKKWSGKIAFRHPRIGHDFNDALGSDGALLQWPGFMPQSYEHQLPVVESRP